MNPSRSFTLLSAIALGAVAAVAQLRTDSVELWFRQSRSVVEPGFAGNGERIDSMLERLAQADSSYVVRSVRVVGDASPEGTAAYNRALSARRARSIFDYFALYEPFAGAETTFDAVGRDWQGLRRAVEADVNVPDRAEVLDVVDRIITSINGGTPDSQANLNRLKAVGGGRAYAYMYRRLFPALRNSRIYVDFSARTPLHRLSYTAPYLTLDTDSIDTSATVDVDLAAQVCDCRPFYMAVKSNMLHDVLALPSVGVEFYVGKNMSVVGNWTYGWWDTDRRHRYWRAYGGDLALRWWFGKAAHEKPLTGHHLGVYGGVFTYDFEWGGTGYMGGRPGHSLWDRWLVNAGIEYGYSLPVSRRINIDFTIGLGYVGGQYYKYRPSNGYYVYESTHKVHYFGPAKVEVSFVWLIGCGNYNRQKGGSK